MLDKSSQTYKDFAIALGKIQDAVKSKTILAPIVIYGPSSYLGFKACNALRDSWLQLYGDDDSFHSFDADDLDLSLCDSLVEQRSLFQSSTLYMLKRCEKKLGALLTGQLGSVASSGQEQWIFAFSPSDKLPAKLSDLLQKMGAQFVCCVDPFPADLPRFILSLAKRFGVALSLDAASLFVTVCGNDLFQIDNELSKIALIFAGREAVLTPSDITPYLNILREDHAFELTNFILKRKGAQAQMLLEDLLGRGESGLAILGLFARHCRNAIAVSELHSRRSPLREIASILRLPVPVVNLYNDYVRSQPHELFASLLIECARADEYLKSSRISEELVLSSLLVSMT